MARPIRCLLVLATLAGCDATVLAPPPLMPSGATSGSSGSATRAAAASSSSGGSGGTASGSGSGTSGSSGAASTSSSSSSSGSVGSTGSSSSSASSTSSSSSSSSGGSTGTSCTCGANARCESGQCVCLPGFTAGASGCEPVAPGDPTSHTQAEVCQAWKDGHVENASSPFTAGAAQCDPGSIPAAALDDALRRLNMFRWMVGEGPTTDDASDDANDQACATIAANNPPGAAAHHPDPSWTCYSAAGAAGAGSSNIAWGCWSAAGAMDQWMDDWGNATTLGHRRWILNPPLGPVGVGFYSGGSGTYGSASCLGVFGMSGTGPHPSWYAWPPPGFVPSDAVYSTWSLHSGSMGVGSASIAVTRLSDGATVPITVQQLAYGYGEDAISWTASGTPAFEAGQSYRVSVSNLSSAPDFTYDVSIVTCP